MKNRGGKIDWERVFDLEARRLSYMQYAKSSQVKLNLNDAAENNDSPYAIRLMEFNLDASNRTEPDGPERRLYLSMLVRYQKDEGDDGKLRERELDFKQVFCYGGLFPNDALSFEEYKRRHLKIQEKRQRCDCCRKEIEEEEIPEEVYLATPPDSNPPTL